MTTRARIATFAATVCTLMVVLVVWGLSVRAGSAGGGGSPPTASAQVSAPPAVFSGESDDGVELDSD